MIEAKLFTALMTYFDALVRAMNQIQIRSNKDICSKNWYQEKNDFCFSIVMNLVGFVKRKPSEGQQPLGVKELNKRCDEKCISLDYDMIQQGAMLLLIKGKLTSHCIHNFITL